MAHAKPLDYTRAPDRLLRAIVFRRDKFTCIGCRATVPENDRPKGYMGAWPVYAVRDGKQVKLMAVHLALICHGGRAEPDNLGTMCTSCGFRHGLLQRATVDPSIVARGYAAGTAKG